MHWIVALLFLGAYAAVYYRHWFTVKGMPENITAAQLHFAFGFSVGVFVLLRVVWRLTHRPPALPSGPLWRNTAARISHGLLYFFMIAMPLTGYMGTKVAPKYLVVVPGFPDTALYDWLVTGMLDLPWEQWEAPLDSFHHFSGEFLVWTLIALHAAAALYHQYRLRDGLMRRMWF